MEFTTQLSLEWILSAIGVTVAFIVGLWQYRRAQRQERVALLLPLISEFETDEELQAGCHLFDYDGGTFTLKGQEHSFENAVLLRAMKVVEWDQDWPPTEEAIREVLDRYFDFFGKLWSFVEIGLLEFHELRYFYYYLEILAAIDRYKGPGFANALNGYLDAYRFGACRKCVEAYRALPRSQREELDLPADGNGGAGRGKDD